MARESIDVEQSNETDHEHHDEHDRSEHDDQSVGDGARSEDDRAQDLVVDDVEAVVEEA